MKKLLLVASIFILPFITLTLSSPCATFSHAQDTNYYAKVQSEGIFFYSLPYDESENRLFEIPVTYFVILTGEANDEFYYATYQDLEGYVKVDEVVVMDGVPIRPFADCYFRVYSRDGLGIYHLPTDANEYKISTIPYLTENIPYYGQIEGSEYVPNKSNIWYYCKFSGEKEVFGYVSSIFCDDFNPEEIPINYETFSVITDPAFSTDGNLPGGLSPVAMTFIIIGVSLPCLVVFYLLIKPSWMKDKVLNEKSKGFKKRRHRDYFEFDEKDLN